MSPSNAASLSQTLQSSWVDNAAAWTEAVRTGAIPSRQAGTDAAIVNAVRSLNPRRILDVGCGEGWLCRSLEAPGIELLGIDASAPLIEAARVAGGSARFETLSYDSLVARANAHRHRDAASPVDALLVSPFDVVVFNFALLEADITPLLVAARSLLAPSGRLVIQTVHPFTACGDLPYANGWRVERFNGFGGRFPAAMPWFFRTFASWLDCLRAADFTVDTLQEPTGAADARPLSLLVVARGELQHPSV